MDQVDLDQFHHASLFTIAFHHKATFALIVNMLVVQGLQFGEGGKRLFEPVAHHIGIVVQLMHELQIHPFQRAQFDVRTDRHRYFSSLSCTRTLSARQVVAPHPVAWRPTVSAVSASASTKVSNAISDPVMSPGSPTTPVSRSQARPTAGGL